MPGSRDWSSLAASVDLDELREHILTGFKTGKPFTAYTPTLPLPSPFRRVLDFGCGLGRNFPYLTSVADVVVGFDLPAMIGRCRAVLAETAESIAEPPESAVRRIILEDDWSALRTERFDLIYAALVLQHVETDACRAYLADFARMAPAVYLLTRTEGDFGASVLDLIEDAGAFDTGPCIQVDHDPDTHQLRVLERTTFPGARRSSGSRHYEMLLRSR